MRRIAALLLLSLLAGACSRSEPAETVPSSTSSSVGGAVTTSEAPTTTEVDPCRSVEGDLDDLLDDIAMDHLAGRWDDGGELPAGHLIAPVDLAGELGLVCHGSFVAASPLGEAVQVHAAWSEDSFNAMVLWLAFESPLDGANGPSVIASSHRGRLGMAGDVIYSRNNLVAEWLRGFVGFAGDSPEEVIRAWNRHDRAGEAPILSFINAGADGTGALADYTLYADGVLITPGPASRYLPTFAPGIRINYLSTEQVAEIEAAVLATGITEGASMTLSDTGNDFSEHTWGVSRVFSIEYWHDDLGYWGIGAQLQDEEIKEPRVRALELESLLEAAARSNERTNWMESDIVVKVFPHGLYDDANEMTWPGEFDLAEVSGELCVLLRGADAMAYRDDVALIGSEYQHRLKTFFDFNGVLYSVHASPLLPGSSVERASDLPMCSGGESHIADPALHAWLWSLRGIDEYEMTLRAECADCVGDEFVLDGNKRVDLPGWAELSSVGDLYDLAARDELELVALSPDGLVGVPITLAVRNPASGDVLHLQATFFTSEQGRIQVWTDDAGVSISRTGFEEFFPEGY